MSKASINYKNKISLWHAVCAAALCVAIAGSAAYCAPKGYVDCVSDALVALESGQTRDSSESLRQALSCNSNDPLAHTAMGLTLLTGGQVDSAMSEFSAALDLDPGCGEAMYGQGLVCLTKNQLNAALTHFTKALSAKPDLGANGAIQYIRMLSGAQPEKLASDSADEAAEAMQALALMNERKYAEAQALWSALAQKGIRHGFGERIGCAMTFAAKAPVMITGWTLKPEGSSGLSKKKSGPVSGTVTLKADLSLTRDISIVAFFVDDHLVGMTNHIPFDYEWDTTRVSNGTHVLKIEGSNADAFVVSRKSTHVMVLNAGYKPVLQAVKGSDADGAWQHLRSLLALKPSVALVNYNLALCALKSGHTDTAEAALERVMADDPDYADAAQRLSNLYHPDGKFIKLRGVKTNAKIIALTFDDGPKPETPQLLDVLNQQSVKATFFVVGKQVELYPEITGKIAGCGHEIENHTYNHRALQYLSRREILQEVFKTVAAVRLAAGVRTHWVRPPGGRYGDQVQLALTKFGINTTFWTTLCSPVEGTSKEKMIRYVLRTAKPGSIVLMHNVDRVTLSALPAIINALKTRGYSFVTLSELTKAGDYVQ